MPEFILDTSGAVNPPAGVSVPWPYPLKWHQLSEFTQGYIEALFFTNNEPGTTRDERMTTRGTVRKSWEALASEGQQKDMPGDYGFANLAPESLLAILNDCREFEEQALMVDVADPLTGLHSVSAWDYVDAHGDGRREAGRDFWYTRNDHGCGFWDGDWPEPYASALDEAANAFGESDVYLGDDGLVYLA